MVPLYIARVADLRVGTLVGVICRSCGHLAEVPSVVLRGRLHADEFVKHLGPQFRCKLCNSKGADVDARRALGHYG
jgi:hypothetical protein